MGPIIALFNFTVRQTLLHRRIWLALLILASPSALHLIIRLLAPPADNARDMWEMYHVTMHFMVMMMLVPLVCMVHGVALIGAEVEAGTMVYLITRKMRRATVLVVKFLATALVLTVLCEIGLIGVHLMAIARRGVPAIISGTSYADWSPSSDLQAYMLAVPLAVLTFLAIFSVIGLLTARPIAASAVYFVAAEMILSNLPFRVRTYSLSHYLRVTMSGMMPRVTSLYELKPDMLEELYPTGASAIPELLGFVLVAVVIAAILVTVRELTPSKVTRE